MELFVIIGLALGVLFQNLSLRALEARVKDLESRPYRTVSGD